jgi:TATA-binding protein-associated factor Taf7
VIPWRCDCTGEDTMRAQRFRRMISQGVADAINPDLERFLAKRMNATTVELEAGHLSLVSHPKEVAI